MGTLMKNNVIEQIGQGLKRCMVLDGGDYNVRLHAALETVEIVA